MRRDGMDRIPSRLAGRLSARGAAIPAAAAIALTLWSLAGNAWAGNRISGRVAEVDAATGRLVVVDAGRRKEVNVPQGTPIREGATDKSLADVKKGDRVVVTVSLGDAGHATRVSVAGPDVSPHDGGRGTMVPGFADGLDARTTRTR